MTPWNIRIGHESDYAEVVDIDDDATQLYLTAGVILDLKSDHPFTVAERARWLQSLQLGRTYVASEGDRLLGFAALALVDGEPYLDQISVRLSAMHRGIGRALLERAVAWASEHGERLWLTTYGHLSWNRPFYERLGFACLPEAQWGPELAEHVAMQRRHLPYPEHRVVMVRKVPKKSPFVR